MTGQLAVFYEHEQQGKPILVGSGAEVDALLDQVRDKFQEEGPVLLEVSIVGAEFGSSHMLAGVDGERGVLFYSGGGHGSFWSRVEGASESGVVTYYYMGNNHDFPVSAEVPLDTVKQALREYLASDGKRPVCVEWEPYDPWSLPDVEE